MDCARCREAISAGLDGEVDAVEAAAADAHTARCPGCATFAEEAAHLNRVLRVQLAAEVPDLSTQILARIGPAPPRSRWRLVLRGALVAVAAVQLVLAVPPLLGLDAYLHVGRELASWHLALGVGFLLVAWQPVRALGLFPFVSVAAVALLLTATVDVAGGHASAVTEARHLVELAGLALLWLLARGVTGLRRAGG